MDPRTGEIVQLTTEEEVLQAKANGLIPITPQQAQQLSAMTVAERINWALLHQGNRKTRRRNASLLRQATRKVRA